MNPSLQAEAVTGTGRGALIVAMFGAGWLGWGLGAAKAFNGLSGPAFGFVTLFLLAYSIYTIQKGRLLRKKFQSEGATERRPILKQLLLVALMETLSILLVSILAGRLFRAELATDWCAMIVGLHFLPLARIFRSRIFLVLGVLMVLWCALCWALFRSNLIAISASLGSGILLWGACVTTLWRARRLLHSASV